MAAITPHAQARRGRHGNRGNALVEFALVLPVLLLVFAGIVDFGFVFQRYEVLTNAVREGARVAVLPMNATLVDGNYTFNTSVINQRVQDFVRAGLGLGNDAVIPVATVTPHTVGAAPNQYTVVTVRLEMRYTYIVIGHVASLLGAGGDAWGELPLAAEATMRVEGQ